MATYFESINDNNTVQITDAFSNLVLWKKGKVLSTLAQNYPQAYNWTIQFTPPASGARPLIVIQNNNQRAYLAMYQVYNQNLVDFRIIGSRAGSLAEGLGQELIYYIFIPSDSPEITLPGTGLLCIRNEEGKLIFDSDANYLKVLDYYESNYMDRTKKVYPTATDIGLAICQPQWYVVPGTVGGQVADYWGQSAYITSERNALQFGYYQFRIKDPISLPDPNNPNNISRPSEVKVLVLDVSHLQSLPFDWE